MRVVIQRVIEASVKINGQIKGKISNGLLLFLGIENSDNHEDIQWLVNKIINLRIFNDANEVMNKSVLDIDGNILVISQFTLYASTKKGHRPSYIKASKPDFAFPLYEKFKEELTFSLGKPIQSGIFGADMKIYSINDGPVTIIIDSKNKE